MRDFLKIRHPEVWRWFQSTEAQSDYREAIQLELLKATYRMEREAHRELYELVDETVAALGLKVPVTLYQAQSAGMESAALYFTPGHGHVVFVGRILALADQSERRALVGHELAHFKLWTIEDGDFLVADRILAAMANEPRATPAHFASARLWQLYTEVYADRGSALVTGDHVAATSMLVKIFTGLEAVDPASYVRQAEDIFAQGAPRAEGLTHPEPFIRARALALWSGGPDAPEVEDEVVRMIEGPRRFEELDLLGQERLMGATRRLLGHHLRSPWLRTGRLLSHAGLFFPSGWAPAEVSTDRIRADWTDGDEALRDYACYLLLDFAAADPDLEENGLAAAFRTADELEIGDRFEELARAELNLRKRDTVRIRAGAAAMVDAAAGEEHDERGA